jgi:hypothetical protein
MKRHMDLIRQLLLEIEANPSATEPCEPAPAGYSEEEIAYHATLLREAGLIEGADTDSRAGAAVAPIRLTWAGHEFLDVAREPRRWTEAKRVLAKVGGASLSVWKKVLAGLIIKHLGL